MNEESSSFVGCWLPRTLRWKRIHCCCCSPSRCLKSWLMEAIWWSFTFIISLPDGQLNYLHQYLESTGQQTKHLVMIRTWIIFILFRSEPDGARETGASPGQANLLPEDSPRTVDNDDSSWLDDLIMNQWLILTRWHDNLSMIHTTLSNSIPNLLTVILP